MINMPFLGASVQASFMWLRSFTVLRFARAVLFSSALATACGESSVPSPFVTSDAAAEASAVVAPDAAPPPEDAGGPDGPSEKPGEWGGPCIDDRSCDDGVSCTSDVCDAALSRCHFVPDDSRCDDGAYCNGREECAPVVGCRHGEAVACSDGTPCTIDACDETTDSCSHTPRDADGDGDPDGNCPSGGDCNDADPAISSQRPEICSNDIDDNCNGVVDEVDCVSPKYDLCSAPLDVTASSSFVLNTAAAHLDYAASCVSTSSRYRDLVVAVHVPSGGGEDVDLVLQGTGGAAVSMAAASSCGDASSEITCAEGAFTTGGTPVARLRLRGLAEGIYPVYLFSDSPALLTLSVDYVPAEPKPANETCGTAEPISPGVPVTASLVDAAADLTSACGLPFADLVYDFVLTEARDVRVFASSKDSNGTPILSLRNAECTADAAEILCHEDTNDALYYRALGPGHYFLAVGATGPSDVDVLLQSDAPTVKPSNENCSGAPDLVPAVTTTVDLVDHMDDVRLGCGVGMPDAAYALTIGVPSDVLLAMGVSSGDTAAVSLSKPACDESAVESCSTGSATPLRTLTRDVPPGDYRVVVESKKSNPVTVTAFLRPTMAPFLVPFSDDCSQAIEIPETGGSFQGNTANSTNDFTASCDVGGGPAAPDQLLHLRLQKTRRVVFDSRGSDYATIIDVRAGSACPGDEVIGGCSAGYSSGRSFIDLTLPAGDYWVQMDGYDSSSGPWVLDVFSSE
jgi:hypothetical protein